MAKPAGPVGPTPKPRHRGGKPKGPRIAHGLERLANQQIKAAERPILQQIARERAANLARAQAQMGFAKAAAAIMQQAAPNVQAGYTNAANSSAGYAKGLGDIVQGNLDANAQANNAFLEKMGTPTGGLTQAPNVGGISFGTQGYIPATALQREGAAWGAAAQLAPGHLLASGQQQAAGILANNPNITQLQQELARIAATRPDVYRQLVAQAQAQRNARIAQYQAQQRIRISQQNADLSAQRLAEERRYHNLSIQMQQEGLALRFRKDARAVADAIAKGKKPDASLSRIYGYVVDHNGNPILNKRGKRIKVHESSSAGLPPWANPNTAASGGGNGAAANNIVSLAREYLGTPYVWGGSTPKGFDCSGFAQFLYNKVGISIPRTTYTQWDAPNGVKVGKRGLRPGDLVFFKGSDSIVQNGRVLPGHVGIYIGNGMMIDAPYTGAKVRIDRVNSVGGYMGARRYRRMI